MDWDCKKVHQQGIEPGATTAMRKNMFHHGCQYTTPVTPTLPQLCYISSIERAALVYFENKNTIYIVECCAAII
jgi:hypothetical protein